MEDNAKGNGGNDEPNDLMPVPVTDGRGNPLIVMFPRDLARSINALSPEQYNMLVEKAVEIAKATKGEGREGQQDRKPKGFGKS
jgi:hypothetical protein